MFKVKFPLPLKNVYLLNSGGDWEKKSNFSNNENPSEKKSVYLASHIEQIKKLSYQRGFNEGKKQAESGICVVVEIFKQVAEKLELEKQSFLERSERQLIEMAVAIAKRIIRKEVSVDPEIVRKVAHEALQKVVDSPFSKIVMRVNPRDWESIMQINSSFLPPEVSKGKIRIEKDDRIQPGGCIVETDRQLVNASIEHQIQQIWKALTGEER